MADAHPETKARRFEFCHLTRTMVATAPIGCLIVAASSQVTTRTKSASSVFPDSHEKKQWNPAAQKWMGYHFIVYGEVSEHQSRLYFNMTEQEYSAISLQISDQNTQMQNKSYSTGTGATGCTGWMYKYVESRIDFVAARAYYYNQGRAVLSLRHRLAGVSDDDYRDDCELAQKIETAMRDGIAATIRNIEDDMVRVNSQENFPRFGEFKGKKADLQPHASLEIERLNSFVAMLRSWPDSDLPTQADFFEGDLPEEMLGYLFIEDPDDRDQLWLEPHKLIDGWPEEDPTEKLLSFFNNFLSSTAMPESLAGAAFKRYAECGFAHMADMMAKYVAGSLLAIERAKMTGDVITRTAFDRSSNGALVHREGRNFYQYYAQRGHEAWRHNNPAPTMDNPLVPESETPEQKSQNSTGDGRR